MDNIEERKLRYADALISSLTELNRATAGKYLTLKTNGGIKPSSRYNIAKALKILDDELSGRRFEDVTPETCISLISRLRRVQSPSSVHHASVLLKAFLRWLLGRHDLGRELSEALHVNPPALATTRRVVSPADWDALLRAAASLQPQRVALRSQVLLHGLRETGMRASELLSLNVGSVEFLDPSGALLRLPPGAPRLKTGPRTVAVGDYAVLLKAWLAAHPGGDHPDTPLFPAERCGPGLQRTTYHALLLQIRSLCKRAGLEKPYTPHDFRHTRATEMVRNRWPDETMNKALGWKAGSRMKSVYVHLVDDDMIDQVRRDAGVDPLAKVLREDPKRALAEAVGAAVAETLRQLGVARSS